MNDFTREELQELRDFLEPESDWYRLTDFQCSIRDKLQYMIDNYCEHECQHESNGNVQALLVNPPIYTFTCKKCGKGYR